MDREMLKGNAKEQLRGKWLFALRALLILTVLESGTNLLDLLERFHLVNIDSSISNWMLLIVLLTNYYLELKKENQ